MGTRTLDSLTALAKTEKIQSLHENSAFFLWWASNLTTVVNSIRKQWNEFESEVEDDICHVISSQQIQDYDIPDDNGEAWVASAWDPEIDIEWDSAESLGEGLAEVPVHFEVEIELQFSVFRSDAFGVPDWVSVTLGDFEDDHYFAASGSRTARYSGRLVFEFDESIMEKKIDVHNIHISIEDAEFKGFTNSESHYH